MGLIFVIQLAAVGVLLITHFAIIVRNGWQRKVSHRLSMGRQGPDRGRRSVYSAHIDNALFSPSGARKHTCEPHSLDIYVKKRLYRLLS